MPKKRGGEVMNYKTMVRLPDQVGEDFERVASEKGLDPAVLARLWIMERLQEERERRGRGLEARS